MANRVSVAVGESEIIRVGFWARVISAPPTLTVTGKPAAIGGSVVVEVVGAVVVVGVAAVACGDWAVVVVAAVEPQAVTSRESATNQVVGRLFIRRFIQNLLVSGG
jgi:hypothetical protein